MANHAKFIVEFPAGSVSTLHWWVVRDGAVARKGRDPDPLRDAGIDLAASEPEPFIIIALLPSVVTHVRWHKFEEALTDKQIMAAASVDAQRQSLHKEHLHIAAVGVADGTAATASIDRGKLSRGLTRLQSLGVDPDVITPAGWLIPTKQNSVIQANFGFDRLLRADQMIAPDDLSLREYLVQSRPVISLSEAELDDAVAQKEPDCLLNLRRGPFTKKSARGALTPMQKKLLAGMTAALLLISLCIPLGQLIKYHLAAGGADSAALLAARSILGQGAKLETVEAALDRRLHAENRGNAVFSVPSSALFSALQQAPAVTLGPISYQGDGVVSATLTAIRNEDINPVLVALQTAGFVITAKPRTDATGTALADITVRGP